MDETERTPNENRTSVPTPSPEPFPGFAEQLEIIRAETPTPAIQDAKRREDAAMHQQHPGEYVAYRDTCGPRAFCREILAHNTSLKAVHDAIEYLTDREMDEVRVTFCEDPNDTAARGGYDRWRVIGVKASAAGE